MTDKQRAKRTAWEANVRTYTRVGCLAANLRSTLMWSHYADEHRGICLEYATADMPQQHARNYLYPVHYSSKRFDLTPWTTPSPGEPETLAPLIGALHKAQEWSYEQEWRIVRYKAVTMDGWGGIRIPFVKPSAVYLGCRITSEDEERVREVAGSTPVLRMAMSESEYALDPVTEPTSRA